MFLKLVNLLLSDKEKKESKQIPVGANTPNLPPPVPAGKADIPYSSGAKEFFARLKSIDRRYIFGATALAVITALASYSKALIVIPVFIVLAACSRYLQLGFPFVIGVDLCLFFTVLAGLAYGPVAGAVVGLCSALLGIVVKNTRNPEDKLAFYVGMAFIGYIAPQLPLQGTYLIGMAAAVLYDAIVVFGYFYLVRKCIVNAFTFTSTHLLFNMWLFSSFGQGLLELIMP